jgi:hypothetical protein
VFHILNHNICDGQTECTSPKKINSNCELHSQLFNVNNNKGLGRNNGMDFPTKNNHCLFIYINHKRLSLTKVNALYIYLHIFKGKINIKLDKK